jgi:capsular exopolysaccharide synthesis family protein
MERFEYNKIDNRSQVSEEYRILRTRLEIVNPKRNSIMLTSCRHGEGKSSTSMNLSLYTAKRKNQKVLLIDLDLRRPKLAKLFRIKQDPDFVDHVRGKCELEETIRYSEEDNLYLMVTRREYSNATEILESSVMQEMIERLHATFDFIVVDTCPCLSTADPMVIGKRFGGALMVVRTRQTQRESLEHAVLALKEHNIPTLGIVLTFMKYFIPKYFYRYQYYHDSYYYYNYYAGKDAVEG